MAPPPTPAALSWKFAPTNSMTAASDAMTAPPNGAAFWRKMTPTIRRMREAPVAENAPPPQTDSSAAALPFVWLDLVEMELLQQHRESETEILDLRATIEQGFGREGGGLPMVCSLPISTKFRLHGLPIEERVKNGTKTLRGRACEAVTTGMGGYYLTWETDVLSTSSRQGLYIGNDKSKARDALLHHLITTGTTEVDALRPLMLHASGEEGAC